MQGMPQSRRPNPYMDLRLADLAARCMKAAGTLEQAKVRTPEQRAQLVERVRYLLIAVSWRLTGNELDYRSPEHGATVGVDTDPRQVFADYVQREQRALRYNAFQRCAEVVLQGHAAAWIRQAMIDGRPARDVASESDDGLQRALASIPDLEAAKRILRR